MTEPTTRYPLAVNVEWTSKCNALCPMCPRDAIAHPELMTPDTWQQTLARLKPEEVFRVVIAGYGEPTTHPRFFEFLDGVRAHPVRFDMVSNGALLDADKLAAIDGTIGLLIVSFSSIDPAVYRKVHANLDQRQVMENLKLARATLRRTQLGISLTPMPECLPSLADTIGWLKAQGIEALTMSPTLYNRGGTQTNHALASHELRRLIRRHGLHSQELDFIPGARAIFQQWRHNRFKCMPRNVDLFIAASGDYLYCYNDAAHRHPIGHVATDSIAATVARREQLAPIDALCGGCNLRDRYGAREVLEVGIRFAGTRLRAAA